MFIAKQGNLIVQTGETLEELESKILFLSDVEISETNEVLELINGKYVNQEEKAQIEHERIQALSMTPLDFIKALEQFAGITYDQIKKLCDTYPETYRELRFCQNVYRSNPMFSEEALSKLPEEFRLTQEQIDNLFVAVDNLKSGNA